MSGALHRLYWQSTRIRFTKRSPLWIAFSVVLVGVSLTALFTRGLNLSIEFTGGTSWVVDSRDLSVSEARAALDSVGVTEAKVQSLGGGRSIRVEAPEVTPETADEVTAALAQAAGVDANQVSKQAIGPSWGQEVSRKALQGLVVFLVLVVLYIALRFEWSMAGTAILELVHDMLLVVGVYALFQFTVSPATVIAILTMLGYTLYDAVVVFDKVEENKPLLATSRYTFSDVVDLSMNQVLFRAMAASITSVLPAAAMIVVGAWLLGANTLQELSLALFVGILAGSYSSIFFATPVITWWNERYPANVELRARVEKRRALEAAQSGDVEADAAQDDGRAGDAVAVGTAAVSRPSSSVGDASTKRPDRKRSGRGHGRTTSAKKKR
jgi:preprotein translocase subunit SecF